MENEARKNPQMKISEKNAIQQFKFKCDLLEIEVSCEFGKLKMYATEQEWKLGWALKH